MSPRAVLLDFDGVIVDTENIHIAAWQRTLSRMGWELSDDAARRAAEIDDRVFLTELFAARKIERPDLDGWLARKQELTESMLADGPPVYPGVVALIEALRSKGIRLGIVTLTWRRNVDIVLTALGVTTGFEVIVAKDDVKAVKPAPECYQSALKRLKLDPKHAVAIEDSPTGTEAARAAGLRVLAVGHRRPPGPRAVDGYIPNFDDLPATLVALGVK